MFPLKLQLGLDLDAERIRTPQAFLLYVWSRYQHHWPSLGAYEKCRTSGPAPDPLDLISPAHQNNVTSREFLDQEWPLPGATWPRGWTLPLPGSGHGGQGRSRTRISLQVLSKPSASGFRVFNNPGRRPARRGSVAPRHMASGALSRNKTTRGCRWAHANVEPQELTLGHVACVSVSRQAVQVGPCAWTCQHLHYPRLSGFSFHLAPEKEPPHKGFSRAKALASHLDRTLSTDAKNNQFNVWECVRVYTGAWGCWKAPHLVEGELPEELSAFLQVPAWEKFLISFRAWSIWK